MYLTIRLVDKMSRAKLMNELIKRYMEFVKNTDNKEVNCNFVGFLDACKVILTEEQIMSAMNEASRRIQLK